MCEKKLRSDCELNPKAAFSGFSSTGALCGTLSSHRPSLCPSLGKLWDASQGPHQADLRLWQASCGGRPPGAGGLLVPAGCP